MHHDTLVPGFFHFNGSRSLTRLHPIEKRWLFGKWLEVHKKVVSWYVCARTVGEGLEMMHRCTHGKYDDTG